MALRKKTGPETTALREMTAQLPGRVADWTPEQRAAQAAQSDAAMREQNGSPQPRRLRRGK
ncbi:hypothetical protein [Streptomyces sp. NPDC002692]